MKRPQRELSIGVWVDNSQILAPKPVPGNLGSTGLYGTTHQIPFLCLAISQPIFGVRSKIKVFYKPYFILNRSESLVALW